MNHVPLIRSIVPLAAIALIAACSTSDGAEDGPTDEVEADQSESTESPLEGVTEPVDLEITAPDGFSEAADAEREVPMSEAVDTWAYQLDGGADTAWLMVSSYYLDEPIDDSDPEAAVQAIKDYDAQLGHEFIFENERGALAHGRSGVGMLLVFEDGGVKLTQQNHYFFEGQHAIQVTCQWTNPDFNGVYDGCQALLSGFPFPDGWTT